MEEQMKENIEQNVYEKKKLSGRTKILIIVALIFGAFIGVIVGMSKDEEMSYIKASDETDAGAVFNMTPDEFIANYNECIKKYSSVEGDFLPKFDEWTETGTEKTDKGNSFLGYFCQVNEVVYTISTTETGDFISFYSHHSDYTMDLALAISAFTNKTEEKEIKSIYYYIYDMIEKDHESGESWNCLYIEGITYTITDSTSLYTATTEEFLEGVNYRKLNIDDLYAETEIVKEITEETTTEEESTDKSYSEDEVARRKELSPLDTANELSKFWLDCLDDGFDWDYDNQESLIYLYSQKIDIPEQKNMVMRHELSAYKDDYKNAWAHLQIIGLDKYEINATEVTITNGYEVVIYDSTEVSNYSDKYNFANICIWNYDLTEEQKEKYNVLKEILLDEEPIAIWVSGEQNFQIILSEEIKEQLEQAIFMIDEMQTYY